jgi:pimeloyl-ACP methyl ester carboxylesterase
VVEVRVNGVSLTYEEYGSGAAILGIHGTGSSLALWRDAGKRLGEHGRAIIYDRRGFGRSERPEPFVSDIRTHADDAAALLDALGASPAVVIGRSQGGEIAVDLALRHPDHVRALALLEGGGLGLSPALRGWLDAMHERLYAAAEEDVGRVLIAEILGDDVWDELPAEMRQTFTDNGPAILAEERAGLLDVTPEQLSTIACPILVLAGRDSPAPFVDATDRMAAAMPAARVEWVEGGHLIDAAHPAVLAFVDELQSTSR